MLASMQATVDTARCLGEFLRFLIQSAGNDFLRAVEEAELSLTQLKAMHVLAADEELSLNGLAGRLGGLSLPTLSRAVEGLVKRGYVTRTEDAADRRIKRLRLTAKGRRTLDRLIEIRAAELEAVLGELSEEERDGLARALAPILERRS
jgi:DNA-binding MarR family transcriptional regulator